MNQDKAQPRIIVVFRNDDLSALSDLDHERDIFALFERHGIPQTLGVIPCVSATDVHKRGAGPVQPLSANPAVCEFLRGYAARSGSEIALHGYTHRTNRYSLPERREFSEFRKLPMAEQEHMLRHGLETVEQALGVRPVTFIPPWNRLDEATVAACAKAGLRILSAGPYVPCVNGIAAFGTNTSLRAFARDWAAAKRSDRRVFIHVLFHSRTVRTPEEVHLLTTVLETVSRDSESTVMTVAEAVRRFPTELQQLNEAGRNVVPFPEVPNSHRAKLWLYLSRVGGLAEKSAPVRSARMAQELYRRGDYTACARLFNAIEGQAYRTLWAGRVLVGFAGGLFAIAAWALLTQLIESFPSGWLWVGAVLPGVTGAVLARMATADETRREALRAGAIATAGFLATTAMLQACFARG